MRAAGLAVAALLLGVGPVWAEDQGQETAREKGGKPWPARQKEGRDAPAVTLRKGTTEWSILAGGADAVSINNSKAGRQFAMQALGWGRVISRRRAPGFLAGRLEVLVEAVPVFVMFQSQRSYGFGVSPLFFRWNFARPERVQPFVEFAGGLLRTDRPVPEDTRRRNFTAQTGLGVRIWLSAHQALLLGYRFHHLSNAGPGEINPSVNSNFFYGGVSILR